MGVVRRWRRSSALAGMLTVCLLAGPVVAGTARADDTTVSVDTARTGWDQQEPRLGPADVQSSDFGRQFTTPVDGQVYAQPLVAGGRVVVATENDKVYGIDGATGAIGWSRDLGSPWPAATVGCGDLVPNIGVTSTPVLDPATRTVYLTAKVNDGPDATKPHWYVHALDLDTGAERSGWPVTVAGAPSNDPTRAFNPETAMQRPGLLLLDGRLFIGFGSHCDFGPYVGYVASLDVSTRTLRLWATEDNSANGMAGVWMGGGGLVSDGPGRVLLSTGNGVGPAPAPGNRPPGQLSESVIRLAVNSDGTMAAQDFFSPANAATLDQNDTDLGSGGPVALPDSFGTAAHPHLLVQIGKDGRVFLLDRDHLGGHAQGTGGTDAVVGTTGPFEGVWGHPAVYGGEGGWVYAVGSRGPLRAYRRGVSGSGQPVLGLAGTSAETFGYTSGSPVVTSDGTTTGSAVVWEVYSSGASGSGGTLRAYRAVPDGSGTLQLLHSEPIGTASKFEVPATSDGRVYVGTRDGQLIAFGRPAATPLTGGATTFPDTPVGSASPPQDITVTATQDVTLTAVGATAPFAVSAAGLPVHLTAGQSYTVQGSFNPTAPGSASGTLTFTVDSGGGSTQAVGFGLDGYGIAPGFTPFPATLAFGTVATGTAKTLTVDITNTGTADETVSGSTAPTGPFTADGLPAAGAVVHPKDSVSVTVTYTPTAAGDDSGSLSVAGPDGTATVSLLGSAVQGQAHLTLTPTSTDFGTVPVGKSVTRTFDIGNSGNIPLTLTKAAPPGAPFVTANPVAEGQQLNPGDVIHQSVTFSPTAVGSATGTYQITADDGSGPQHETVTGVGAAPGSVLLPDPATGGWQLNSAARPAGSDVDLTRATINQSGSAVFPTPVLTDGLRVTFTAVIGGGSGADGMTMALLDPARTTPTARGATGSGLGFGGLAGVAVALDTYRNTGDPSANFVGISNGSTAARPAWAATSTAVPNLRSGPHVVGVAVTGRTLDVSVDGKAVLHTTVAALTPTALLAFTGGTGGATDIHAVRAVTATARSYAVAPPGPYTWVRAGSAVMSGTTLVLTQAVKATAGSAFSNVAVPSARLRAAFTATLGGGTGADGLTLTLLDAARAHLPAVGRIGGFLGYGGLPGVAVTLDTYRGPGDPSANFTAIATGSTSTGLVYAATSTAVPPLRSGPVAVVVAYTATKHLQVTVAGHLVIDKALTLPPNVLVGFTGATGGLTDQHAVSSVTITY